MKRLYLIAEEKDYLEREHALKENGKERDRIKARMNSPPNQSGASAAS